VLVFICIRNRGTVSRSGTTWLDYAILLLLPVDVVARYHQVLRGDPFPDGFFEWALRFRRRKKNDRAP